MYERKYITLCSLYEYIFIYSLQFMLQHIYYNLAKLRVKGYVNEKWLGTAILHAILNEEDLQKLSFLLIIWLLNVYSKK